MARTVLSLALLACLGLAILHLASAQEQNQELEDKTSNNVALQIKPEEQKIRILREADAKRGQGRKKDGASKKGNGKKKDRATKKGKGKKTGKGANKANGRKKARLAKRGKGRGKGRTAKKAKGKKKGKGARKGKGKKNGRATKTGRGKKRGRGGKNRSGKNRKCKPGRSGKKCRSRKLEKGENNKKNKKDKSKKQNVNPIGRQTCDVEALCQKIKDYIKYSNQLRKLRRINKTCSTMEKKRDKASAGEFSASGTANDDSDNTTVQAIADKLKNCTTSAKEKCETKAITGCTNTALNAKCEVELDAWIKKFGPAQGSCLQASASCCACINAITPDPSADCLEFEPLDKASKDKKKECTGSGTDGSFGHCRKLQMQAAEKGPQAHKEKCKDDSKVTTAKPSGRRMIFRNKLMKKFVKT